MRAVALKRARQLCAYRTLRDAFLAERPLCEFPSWPCCSQPATDVHHRRGRVGALLLDVTKWSALCRAHHSWVTEHPKAAVELGISELRVGGAA
jgi:hypothetical protein